MGTEARRAVSDALRERARTILEGVEAAFGPTTRRDPLRYGAPDHAPGTFPDSVVTQCQRIAGIAGALVTDEAGRVACVDVSYADVDWQTPGGAVEPGDSLAETARRETREETGLTVALDGLLYTRLVEVTYDPGVPETPTIPMAVFTGRPTGGRLAPGDIVLPDGREEIADAAWFDPASLPDGTLDREWILAHCRSDRPPGSTERDG